MENTEKKYFVFRAFCKPISDLADHFKIFLKIGLLAAFVLSVLSFLFGHSFACTIPSFENKAYCSENAVLYVFYIIFKLCILSVFLRIWYDAVYLQKNIDVSYFKANLRRFLKTFAAFLFFILLNLIPVPTIYLLLVRVPNPDFRIELCYFTVVSLGFFVPFILLRFYTNLAEYLEDMPFKNFGEVAEKTRFKLSKIFFSFSIVLAFCLFLFLIVSNSLKLNAFEPFFVFNVLAEYVFEVTVLLILCLIVNFIRVQKEIFE